MKQNVWKRSLSWILVLVLTFGLLPNSVFATHDRSNGKPLDLENTVVLTIYSGSSFPGEPSTHTNTGDYTGFNSNFNKGSTYSTKAYNVLEESILSDVTQGPTSQIWGRTCYVWGVFDTSSGSSMDSLAHYFVDGIDNPIFDEDNQTKMIAAAKGISLTEAANYEIVWYVIKYQTSDSYWHIDGMVREKDTYSVNYYGNGNTAGGAPNGPGSLAEGSVHTILGNTGYGEDGNLKKVVGGITYKFVGWNTKPDGSGVSYAPGQKVTLNSSTTVGRTLSLYAQWTDKVYYNATLHTYLNGTLTDIDDIHGEDTLLVLQEQTPGSAYIGLTHSGTGTYTVGLANGTYYPWHTHDGQYHQISNHQLIIQNADGELALHHYSVNYEPNGGAFKAGEDPGTVNYASGEAVNATDKIPVRDGYLFAGWSCKGSTYAPGTQITSGITSAMTLTAQWVKAADVYINVTIDHTYSYTDADGIVHSGVDGAPGRDELTLELVSRLDSSSPYLEVDGYALTLSETQHPSHSMTTGNQTVYTAEGATFAGLSGNAQYSVAVSKHGYDLDSIQATQNADGDWVIHVSLKFHPESFDLDVSVEMDATVPKELYPTAVIGKITYWDEEKGQWLVISQQAGDKPGIRLNMDSMTGMAVGSYPVWIHEAGSANPYGYRFVITAFVYADGSIVSAQEMTAEQVFSDGNYTATMGDVADGRLFGAGLNGAYYASGSQIGTLHAVISVEKYDVIFDAQGGTVNGSDSQTAADQYYIPAFSGYQPVMAGHQFLGWYLEPDCIHPATENALLTQDITLYAKWDQILTGTILAEGTYVRDGQFVVIKEQDLLTSVTVALQQIGKDGTYNVQSVTLPVTWNAVGTQNQYGTLEYEFVGLDPDATYRIEIIGANISATYQNAATASGSYNDTDYTAVFTAADPWETFVNAKLTVSADTYFQPVTVDASAIGSGFRPDDTLVQFLYRATKGGAYEVISYHTVAPYGITVALDAATGKPQGTYGEALWIYHFDGTLYEFQTQVTQIGGKDPSQWPVTVVYGDPARYSPLSYGPSGTLTATLVPNQYDITFNWNVAGIADETFPDAHTWSHETAIHYAPTREGYDFGGWYSDAACTPGNEVTKISAETSRDTTLYAKWMPKTGLELTVYHVNKDTQQTIQTEVKGGLEFGQVITAESLKANINGHTYHSASADSVTIGTGTNEITLYYTQDSYNYTVRYLQQGTNKVLAEQTSGSGTFGQQITVSAKTITGYNVVDANSQTFTIDADNKVITFYYTVREDLTLTVYYRDINDKNKDINPSKTITNMTFGENISVSALAVNIPGYTYSGECDPQNPVVDAEHDTLILYYEKNSYQYQILFYYDGILDDSLTVSGTALYGSQITFSQQQYPTAFKADFALHHVDGAPLTIGTDANKNVIKVYFREDKLADKDAPGSTAGADALTGGDGIPDVYQRTVTYKILNGTWDGTSKDNIVHVFTIYEKPASFGVWPYNPPTLGSTIPTGMQPDAAFANNGAWDEEINADTLVTGNMVYTYSYLNTKKLITAFVSGGKLYVNGTLCAEDDYEILVEPNANASTIFRFEADDGYVLDSVTIDGKLLTLAEMEAWMSSQEFLHDANHTISVVYSQDRDGGENGDGIPDKYQKKVVFRIVNGFWDESGASADQIKFLTIMVTLMDGDRWSETGTASLKVADVPTGMIPVTGYEQSSGAWDNGDLGVKDIPFDIHSPEETVYTYTFSGRIQYQVVIEVVGGDSYPAASSTKFFHDDQKQTTIHFWPFAGYMLESVTVTNAAGTITYTAGPGAINTITGVGERNGVSTDTYTYSHTGNLHIRAVYTPDTNGDNIPDKYQKKVVYKVQNGTWADGTEAEIVEYVSLLSGGQWSAAGQGELKMIPVGMQAKDGYKAGAWDVIPQSPVSGTDTVTYTHSFVKTAYQEITYTVEHHLQHPTGVYLLESSEIKTVLVEMTADGKGYELGKIPVSAAAKDYGAHYIQPDSPINGELEYGKELILQFFYALDSHVVKYDLNGGHATEGVDYADATYLCGSSATVKQVPTYTGYSFLGWLGSDGKTYAVGDVITVDKDITLTAQWNINRYTVTYTDGVDGETVFQDQAYTVDYNTATPAFAGTPSRTGYTFKGWSPVVADTVTRSITYAAQWEINRYTVTFEDEDGTVISQKIYDYGQSVEVPDDPSKASDAVYHYIFAGWSPAVSHTCVGDATYTATYTSDNVDYVVTFVDADGKTISTKGYHYGDQIEIPADPDKAADQTYTYTFAGWTPAVSNTCVGNATYTATYSQTYIDYTVSFLDEDGSVISEKTYHYGDQIQIPADPTKEGNEIYYYIFSGWTPGVSETCVGHAVYTATYSTEKVEYTVVFKDSYGKIYSSAAYHYGDTVRVPADPTKAASNAYSYVFIGWSPKVSTVCVGDAVYIARFNTIRIRMTVSFVDEDGSVISSKTYHYGDKIVVPEDPVKASDGIYTYTFAGWTPAVSETCVGNATYTATYARERIEYTVKFVDENGTVISTNTYFYGDKIQIPADPVKAADEAYTYAFAGWTPAVSEICVGDATYTATYTATNMDYKVTFVDEDGSVISSKTYHYGDQIEIPADPVKAADHTYTYAFAGWSPAVSHTCVGNATYEATYISTNVDYVVTFKDADGTTISSKGYHYGDKIEVPADPDKAADNTYTYTFAGWTPAVSDTCVGNATYTATYTPAYVDYTVTFVDENGSVISSKTYHYGDKIEVPADPVKAADETYTYAFTGWTPAVSEICVGDATYTASYQAVHRIYKVTYTDGVMAEDVFADQITDAYYGQATPAFVGTPVREGYLFTGWAPNVAETVTGDVTYVAQWVRRTTPIVPGNTLRYIVEHYVANADGSYPAIPTDREILSGVVGQVVTAEAKQYDGFCLNPLASTMTGVLVELESEADIVILKLYYDVDAVGNGDSPDNIPDMFQKKIIFKVVNGKWSDDTADDKVVYVTLEKDGKWDATGTAKLTAPTGMQPNEGFAGGAWDVMPPETVSGTNTEIYTYTFTKSETPVDPGNPETGDNSVIGFFVLTMLLPLAGLIVLTSTRKRRQW